jgi:hypothetical protein
MPVARYFLFVGGALLALLLAFNAFLPQEAAVASNDVPTIDKTVVRIRSDQKPPERVVYDTSSAGRDDRPGAHAARCPSRHGRGPGA